MKILLAGRKRSGKDTAAAYLTKLYGGESFSFAKPLYDIMYAYQDRIGVPRHKDRKFLQWLGDFARQSNPDVWINLCFSDAAKSSASKIFITDGRYENELDGARDRGYTIVKIDASDEIRRTRLDPDDNINDTHKSEHGYPDDYPFDYVLTNNWTMADFEAVLKDLGHKLTHPE